MAAPTLGKRNDTGRRGAVTNTAAPIANCLRALPVRRRFVCLRGNDTGQKESGNDYGTLKAELSVGTADPAVDSFAFLPLAKIKVRLGQALAADSPPDWHGICKEWFTNTESATRV